MAIQLNGKRAWRLLDFFDSRQDLKEKKLRVLHNLSFEDDPTRAFRVVRFAERYGFSIGTQTLSLLENAIRNNLFDRLSGKRLFSELKIILSENNPWRHISHLSRLKLLRFIHPKLHEINTIKHRFGEIDQAINWYNLMFAGNKIDEWLIYLIGLFEKLSLSEMKSACQRLAVSERLLDRALQARRETDPLLAKLARSDISSSTVYNILHPLTHETLVYVLSTAHSQQAKKSISLYLTHLKDIKLSIGGDDLISMGVEPGPIYRELLDATRDALLNGELEQGEVYERTYARRFLALHKPD
jgi:tRNA nucleotidyltransferase (CCA-adding enzyme)